MTVVDISSMAPTEPSSPWPWLPQHTDTVSLTSKTYASDASSDSGTDYASRSQGRDFRNAKMAYAKLCGVDLRSACLYTATTALLSCVRNSARVL